MEINKDYIWNYLKKSELPIILYGMGDGADIRKGVEPLLRYKTFRKALVPHGQSVYVYRI